MKPVKPHKHNWSVIGSRYLHGVEPKTKINTQYCAFCGERREVEIVVDTQKPSQGEP